jgi:anaerobic dimethyl sulfoxide reductase subunit A
MNKAIEPIGECRSDYWICSMIAGRLGLGERYTEGRTELEWLEHMTSIGEAVGRLVPRLRSSSGSRACTSSITSGLTCVRAVPARPGGQPSRDTVRQDRDLFRRLADMEHRAASGDPQFIPEWEGGPWDPLYEKYPLQAFGRHFHRRTHSTLDNVDWLEEAMPQRCYMNPMDAALARNTRRRQRESLQRPRSIGRACSPDRRIIPGLVDIPQGAWWTPDRNGVDRRRRSHVEGSVNVTDL